MPQISGFTNLDFLARDSRGSQVHVVINAFCIESKSFCLLGTSPGKKFDACTGKELPTKQASKFLGIEFNTFLSYYPFASLKCFAIGSVFFPGKFFKDIKGKPFDGEEKKALEAWQKINASLEILILILPNIGDDIGYTINLGLEFAF